MSKLKKIPEYFATNTTIVNNYSFFCSNKTTDF